MATVNNFTGVDVEKSWKVDPNASKVEVKGTISFNGNQYQEATIQEIEDEAGNTTGWVVYDKDHKQVGAMSAQEGKDKLTKPKSDIAPCVEPSETDSSKGLDQMLRGFFKAMGMPEDTVNAIMDKMKPFLSKFTGSPTDKGKDTLTEKEKEAEAAKQKEKEAEAAKQKEKEAEAAKQKGKCIPVSEQADFNAVHKCRTAKNDDIPNFASFQGTTYSNTDQYVIIGDKCYFRSDDPVKNRGFEVASNYAKQWDMVNYSNSWKMSPAEAAKLELKEGGSSSSRDGYTLYREKSLPPLFPKVDGRPVQTKEMEEQGVIAFRMGDKTYVVSHELTPDTYDQLYKMSH
ncbi:MAG: hypothetical protein WA071_01960 [Undibacterium umbellatum]|uniref:hypothetical protein n=1 Tax=Undibacterium umbellatum TaxID=2762300 RepID=UPI003BB53EB9